jgi:hypothetical protein
MFFEERAALRELFLAPAACSETIWAKLAAFEADLIRERIVGESKDSILLLGLGSIKADLMNLGIKGRSLMSESQADVALIALASLCEAAGRRTDVAADALAEAENASPRDKAAEDEAYRLQGLANDEFKQLSTPMLRMRASTLEGVFAKAKAFKLTSFPKGIANRIEEGLEDDEGVCPTPISLSLVRDLLVLVDQPALLTHADAAPPKGTGADIARWKSVCAMRWSGRLFSTRPSNTLTACRVYPNGNWE